MEKKIVQLAPVQQNLRYNDDEDENVANNYCAIIIIIIITIIKVSCPN